MKEEDFGFETGRVLKEIPGWENSELLRSLQEQIDPNEWVLKTVLLSVADDEDLKRISQEIEQANKRLEEHEAEREDFAFSIFCGSLAGDVDSLLSGLFGSSGPGEGISLEEISEFLQKMNTVNGFDFSGVLQFIKMLLTKSPF